MVATKKTVTRYGRRRYRYGYRRYRNVSNVYFPCHVDMNPILLKPQSDHTSQVVLNGRLQFLK